MSQFYKIEEQTEGSGFYMMGTAGEALGRHKLVYRAADSTWHLADANATTTMLVYGITLGAISIGLRGGILLYGYLGDTGWSWTVGGESGIIYASGTPGELTQTAPGVPGDEIQGIAVALTPTAILFAPPGIITASGGGLGAHHLTHIVGGVDAFVAGNLLDATAKVAVRKNTGANVGSRRRINLIEGAGVSLTVADDAGDEEVDITIANSGAASLPFYNFGTTTVANGGTITHGCTGTPTRVRIMANGTIPIEFAFTVDATNITVYHTSGGSPTVFWEAEV